MTIHSQTAKKTQDAGYQFKVLNFWSLESKVGKLCDLLGEIMTGFVHKTRCKVFI